MYTSKEDYVRAVEASMVKNSSEKADRAQGLHIQYGRCCYREYTAEYGPYSCEGDEFTLEECIKRFIAQDFLLAKRNDYDPSDLVLDLANLFNVTAEYVVGEQVRLNAEYDQDVAQLKADMALAKLGRIRLAAEST